MKELILKNIHSVQVKRLASLAILVSLVGAVLLSGCDGQAIVNFTYDATTGAGSGSVQITGAAPADNSGGDTSGNSTGGSAASSQVVLFGVVVVLLIGTLAVVAASARRRRLE